MSRQSNIYLMCSYPKSGNTWLRIFIHTLKQIKLGQVDININSISVGNQSSNRSWIESSLGLDLSELSHDEIDLLRPVAYTISSKCISEPAYIKVHDAYSLNSHGNPIFPKESVNRAVYIVRNPLDIVVSLAHHDAKDIDTTIEKVNDSSYAVCSNPSRFASQLRQKLFSWSEHVQSWVQQSQIPTFVVRYEDMLRAPVTTFTSIAEFLHLSFDDSSIQTAIDTCHINKLKQQESELGFREKPNEAERFFRKGIVGDWKNHLNDNQMNQIIDTNREMILKLGYLDQEGHPCIKHSPFIDEINSRVIAK